MSDSESAGQWREALESNDGSFDEKEIIWYDVTSPTYSQPTPAQTEAARRFVSHWLNSDDQDFVIPSNEWGKSLYHWINVLVAREAPKD